MKHTFHFGASPPIVAISGVKNSGKTTFLEGILPLLRGRGLRVSVIKHDGHSFQPDIEGTDSWRIRQAGADGVAVWCDTHFMVIQNGPISMDALCALFPDADLILCEGMKYSPCPKIELVRKGISCRAVCAPETLLAVATDLEQDFPAPRIGLSDYEAAVELILHHVGWSD